MSTAISVLIGTFALFTLISSVSCGDLPVFCCDGYVEYNKDCVPLCNPQCSHGQCVKPNSCRCDFWYSGKICDTVSIKGIMWNADGSIRAWVPEVVCGLSILMAVLYTLLALSVCFLLRKKWKKAAEVRTQLKITYSRNSGLTGMESHRDLSQREVNIYERS